MEDMQPAKERRRFVVEGIVQGVGFRPFVSKLARYYGLCGVVWNDSIGVTIEGEGTPEALDAFQHALYRGETTPGLYRSF